MFIRTFNSNVEIKVEEAQQQGCCGILNIWGLRVIYKERGIIIEEEYKKLDHLKFIKFVSEEFLNFAEKNGYTRIIITDVIPEEIEDVESAYFSYSAPHNSVINLYTILTDAGWPKLGPDFVNRRTGNTVTTFYHDV